MGLSDRIRDVRLKAGLSQTAFGERIGVTRSVINNLEDEKRLTNPERKKPIFMTICSEFGVDYHWLLTGEGDMEPTVSEAKGELIAGLMGLNENDPRFKWCEALANMSDEEVAQFDKILKMLTGK